MCPCCGPRHLLFFAEAFAHPFVHGRLREARWARLTRAISLAIVRDQMRMVRDVGPERFDSLHQLFEFGIRLFESVDQRLDDVDLLQGLVHMAMPQRPLEPRELVPYLLTEH